METIDLETGMKVNITSLNYSGEYPNSAYKRWEISSPPDHAILLQFISFSLEWGYDYLYVYTGTIPSLSNSTRIADLTGQSLPGDTISYEPYMWLVFQSDFTINAEGFLAEVSAINVTGKWVYCIKMLIMSIFTFSWNLADSYDNIQTMITFKIIIL